MDTCIRVLEDSAFLNFSRRFGVSLDLFCVSLGLRAQMLHMCVLLFFQIIILFISARDFENDSFACFFGTGQVIDRCRKR